MNNVLAITHGVIFSQYDNIYRGGGAHHTPVVVSEFLSEDEIQKIDYWFISLGEANSFKYHAMYGGLKDKISGQAEIIIENRSNDIKSQLAAINNRSKAGDQIVMIVGHASDIDIKYKQPFFNV